ncbi:hypothetical protein FACS1894161_5290 [Spirochaetia bacterium]|nr:hypothetical protein FACS1894161_5290 [Spirochaetia bacterium]
MVKMTLMQGRAPVVLAILLAALAACSPQASSIPRLPETLPLSGTALGYAVVSAAYARVLSEPDASAVSLGVVSEGTVLTILERRLVRPDLTGSARSGLPAYWVLTEGTHAGWLPDDALIIYDSKEKALTAAARRSPVH